jgi:hypothetical protein
MIGLMMSVMAELNRSWQEASTSTSTATGVTIMSTKLTNPDEKSSETAVMAERNGSTSGSWQNKDTNAPQKPRSGKPKDSPPTLTAEIMAKLLARVQDIQASWQGADSRVMADKGVLLVALPLKEFKVEKIVDGHGKEVYTVNGEPVVMVDGHGSNGSHGKNE